MPNPKMGAVTTNVALAVTEFECGRNKFHTDEVDIIQSRVAKASWMLLVRIGRSLSLETECRSLHLNQSNTAVVLSYRSPIRWFPLNRHRT
jgi:hypothetical protein